VKAIRLTGAQEKALQDIREAHSRHKVALLEGVTGSGKTEIYLQAARETVAAGKSVLYLVPEIVLGRQLEERVRKVFPDCGVFHSAETAAARNAVSETLDPAAFHLLV